MVTFVDFGLPEVALKVNKRKIFSMTKPAQHIVNAWQRVDVPLRDVVQLPLVDEES